MRIKWNLWLKWGPFSFLLGLLNEGVDGQFNQGTWHFDWSIISNALTRGFRGSWVYTLMQQYFRQVRLIGEIYG